MTYDIIILGQGLAGSLLAWELADRGQEVLVLDDAAVNAASRVATGVINPVTGPRLALTPNADELFRTMRRTINGVETRLGTALFHPLPLIRRFESERMLGVWTRRIAEPAYADYLDPRTLRSSEVGPINAPLGGFRQMQTGRLDSGLLLRLLGDWLHGKGRLHKTKNGFGSKRGLMIPWYAEQFADFLLGKKPLPPEADIARWRRS